MSVPRSGSLWVGFVSDMALNRQFTYWQNSGMSLLFVRKQKSDRRELCGLWNTLGENTPHPSWAQWNLELTGEDGSDRAIHSVLLILLAPGCPRPAADAGKDLLLEEPEHGAQVGVGGHGGEQAAPRAAVSAIRSLFPPWNPLSLCVCTRVPVCARESGREAC